MARPDNFQFMLAAEYLKISNAKGILRTTPENQPLQWWPHNPNQPSGCNKNKIKDSEEVLSMEGTNEKCFLSKIVVNSSTLTLYLLVTLCRSSEMLIKWVCLHCIAGPKPPLPRTEIVNDNDQLQLTTASKQKKGLWWIIFIFHQEKSATAEFSSYRRTFTPSC